MKNFTILNFQKYFAVTLILFITSCGVSDNGAMNFDGQVVGMINFNTDKDIHVIKNNVIKHFGQPVYLDDFHNELLYEHIDFYEFNNIKMKILFVTIIETNSSKGGSVEVKVKNQSVSFAVLDNNNNDLLKKNSDTYSIIKKHLESLMAEYI